MASLSSWLFAPPNKRGVLDDGHAHAGDALVYVSHNEATLRSFSTSEAEIGDPRGGGDLSLRPIRDAERTHVWRVNK